MNYYASDDESRIDSLRGMRVGRSQAITSFIELLSECRRRTALLQQSETWVNNKDHYIELKSISSRYANNIRLWLLTNAREFYSAQLFIQWFEGVVDEYSKQKQLDLPRYAELAAQINDVAVDHELAKDFVKTTPLYAALEEAAARPF